MSGEAERAFRIAFGRPDGTIGPNIITPTVEWRRMVGPYAVELSSGTGLEHEPLFGVTVLLANGERPAPDVSRVFWDRAEAERYIGEIAGLRDDGWRPERVGVCDRCRGDELEVCEADGDGAFDYCASCWRALGLRLEA